MTARYAALLIVGALAVSRPAAAAPDARSLITGLAREAPAAVAFVEARFSSLLREPLIVSGELRYAGPGELERRVTQPYRETTTIRGDLVRVERDGETPRTFGLRRAPELAGYLTAFGALLAGDAAALDDAFAVAAAGEDPAWTLTLTPRVERTRRRIAAIEVRGHGREPLCVATRDTQGGGSVLLLAAATAAPIASDASLEALLARCGAE
jgi:hypothetical protein